jgi:hypothetical protein
MAREETVYVRVTKQEKTLMEKAALGCGLTITGWARGVLKFVSTGEGLPPGITIPAGVPLGAEALARPLAASVIPAKRNGKRARR